MVKANTGGKKFIDMTKEEKHKLGWGNKRTAKEQEMKDEAALARNQERYGMPVLPTNDEECTIKDFNTIKGKLDIALDCDKTGLRTYDSLRKEMDDVAAKSTRYNLGVFDIDNFKKYNSPPLDYE